MKEHQSFRESTMALHLVANYFALNPVIFNKETGKYEASKKDYIYCLIFGLVTASSLSYLVGHAKQTEKEVHSNSISEASFWFDLYAGIFIQISGTVINCVAASSSADLMNRVLHIDSLIGGLGSKLTHTDTFYVCCLGLLAIILEFVITAVPDYILFSTESQTKLFLIISYSTILTNGMIKLQFVVMVHVVYRRFVWINSALKTIKSIHAPNLTLLGLLPNKNTFNYCRPVEDRIRKIHYIHNALCQVCSCINWLHGFQMLCVIGTAFNITTSEFYYTYIVSKKAEEGKLWDIYFSVQWGILQQLEVFIIIFFCKKLFTEACKTVHLLQVLRHSSSNSLYFSLQLFSLHSLHKNVEFTACAIFPLNYNLFLTIIAAITSYLVIMIQYDMAKSTVVNNSNGMNHSEV